MFAALRLLIEAPVQTTYSGLQLNIRTWPTLFTEYQSSKSLKSQTPVMPSN